MLNNVSGFSGHDHVLPTPKDTLFHVEIFVTKDERIYLCEAAARLGGGGINNQIELAYGVNLKMEFVKSQCLSEYDSKNLEQASMRNVAARLLIPPRDGLTLQKIPERCPFEWVQTSHITGVPGKQYSKMKLSNEEIANFLIKADNEQEALQQIKILHNWFNENTVWA